FPIPPSVEIPDDLDPKVASLAEKFKGRIQTFDNADTDAWITALDRSDVLMVWDLEHRHDATSVAEAMDQAIAAKKAFRVDPERCQYEGSMNLKFSMECNPLSGTDLELSREKFSRMVDRLGHGPRGYVFGTGPSLEEVMSMDVSDGVCIACNSMVKNKPLLEKLRPPIITIADPIFHAGVSKYAGKFRTMLWDALDTYDSWLIVPFRDYRLYMSNSPRRFRDRIIGIPLEKTGRVNLDLEKEFRVETISNILTLMLLPLASTLFDEVCIGGCDGRKLSEDGYFWTHHKASQINEEMESIQRAHPGFFAIDFNDYYLRHCETLEQWLAAGEARGVAYRNITHSYIPALRRRSDPGVLKDEDEDMAAVPKTAGDQPLVSVIMPALNAAGTIERAIRSVQDDGYENFELLVIDGHSEDATRDIVTRLAGEDPRIGLLDNPRKGVSAGRNIGLDNAKGEYITFLDADDAIRDGSITKRARFLNQRLQTTAVYTRLVAVDEQLRELWTLKPRLKVSFDEILDTSVLITTIMLRAELARSIRFDEDIANGEDLLYIQRIARMGHEFRLVENCHSIYVQHPRSTVRTDVVGHERAIQKAYNIISDRDPGCPEPDPRYAEGLDRRKTDEVLLMRHMRALVGLILTDETEQDAELLAMMIRNVCPSGSIPAAHIAGQIRQGIIQHQVCNSSQWPAIWRANRARLLGQLQHHLPDALPGVTWPAVGEATDRLAYRQEHAPGRARQLAGRVKRKLLSYKPQLKKVIRRTVRFGRAAFVAGFLLLGWSLADWPGSSIVGPIAAAILLFAVVAYAWNQRERQQWMDRRIQRLERRSRHSDTSRDMLFELLWLYHENNSDHRESASGSTADDTDD
ncbi:MAG: glycosyltransferase family 2 protein, partial [Phycisphaerae bacterium]